MGVDGCVSHCSSKTSDSSWLPKNRKRKRFWLSEVNPPTNEWSSYKVSMEPQQISFETFCFLLVYCVFTSSQQKSSRHHKLIYVLVFKTIYLCQFSFSTGIKFCLPHPSKKAIWQNYSSFFPNNEIISWF